MISRASDAVPPNNLLRASFCPEPPSSEPLIFFKESDAVVVPFPSLTTNERIVIILSQDALAEHFRLHGCEVIERVGRAHHRRLGWLFFFSDRSGHASRQWKARAAPVLAKANHVIIASARLG